MENHRAYQEIRPDLAGSLGAVPSGIIGPRTAGGAAHLEPAQQAGIQSTMDDLDKVRGSMAVTVAELTEKLYPFMINPDAAQPNPPPPSDLSALSDIRARMMNHVEALALLDNLISQIVEQIDN